MKFFIKYIIFELVIEDYNEKCYILSVFFGDLVNVW